MAIAQSTSTQQPPTYTGIGGVVYNYIWTWEGQPLRVAYETLGEGTPVLLLPSFSTVSTRGEMRGIAQHLSSQYQVITLDWPGFGQSERPSLEYKAELYHQFLHDFFRDNLISPIAVVAAGHAAGYVMQLAQKMPQSFSKSFSKIALVAPTWRGPLPTMGVNPQISERVRELVRSPILGDVLYQMNTAEPFLQYMYGSHVYADKAKLTPEFMSNKRQLTQHPGGRYAPVAFVTGAIDPVQERTDFLAWFEPLPAPVIVVIPEQGPPKSKAEMEAIAKLPNVQSVVLPGSLGMHEEYADAVAEVVLQFFRTTDAHR